MEELLNKLIEKGWKPRGYNDIKKITVENNKNVKQKVIHLRPEIGVDTETLTRFICVKESLLRQFVCENGMIKKKGEYRAKRRHSHGWEHDEDVYHDISYTKNDYEYYIIESALTDESELESFILKNIKIGDI